MKKILDKINHFFYLIFRVLEIYSMLVLVAVVVIVSAQVISRKFLRYSIRWSEEVALLLMVWTAFISFAIGVAKNLHISLSMFYNRLPGPAKKASDWLSFAVTIFVGIVMMVNGGRLFLATMSSTLPTTKWPSCTLYMMIPVGGFFTVYCAVLRQFFPDAAQIFERDDPAIGHLPSDAADAAGEEGGSGET